MTKGKKRVMKSILREITSQLDILFWNSRQLIFCYSPHESQRTENSYNFKICSTYDTLFGSHSNRNPSHLPGSYFL